MSFLAASSSRMARQALRRHAASNFSTSTRYLNAAVPYDAAAKNEHTFNNAMGMLAEVSQAATPSKITTPSAPEVEAPRATAAPFAYSPDALPPRADPLLSFLTNLLMKDGKKAQAERFVTHTLRHINSLTHSDPLPLIYSAVETVRPLVKMQSRKQGGKSLQVPIALNNRQSTRKALVWIIEASKKRSDREVHKRLATEFVAVVEGGSSALGRKEEQHKIATSNRANASVRI